MTMGSIARRYATALFDIGEEQGDILGVLEGVESLAEVFEHNKELREIEANPLVKADIRRGILKEIAAKMGVSDVARRFLLLLFDKARLDRLPDISRELGLLVDKRFNRIRVEVTSAAPVSETAMASLKSALERLTGKVVLMTRREDPMLLGGVVTRVQNTIYDGSLRHHLQTLRVNMRGRA
jgi:F-type H+-transporting ATPase subunit delta